MKDLRSNLLKYTQHEFWKIIKIFLIWRIGLILISILAVRLIPLGYKNDFMGGGKSLYSQFPQFFGWANFDGEHYLAIASFGYRSLEQVFFPLYPKLIWLLSSSWNLDPTSKIFLLTAVGLIISNLSLLLSLILLYSLVRIDYPQKIAWWTILLMLIFPTSFFFGAVYSESIFLLFSVCCFYFYKKGNFFWSGLFGAFASATRVFGILIFFALILDAWYKRYSFKKIFWLGLIPVGLILYMVYLWVSVHDPLAFFHLQPLVGEQRQSGFILLPQVFFRYIKMTLTTPSQNPIFQTIIFEFFTGVLFLGFIIYGFFKKIPVAYLVYLILGYFSTTFQGSLSSTPRYALVLFPAFLIYSIIFNKLISWQRIFLIIFSALWLVLETALFIRVYWIA